MKKLILFLFCTLFSSMALSDCLSNEKQVIEFTKGFTQLELKPNTYLQSAHFSSYNNGSGRAMIKNKYLLQGSELVIFDAKWENKGSIQINTGRMKVDTVINANLAVSNQYIVSATNKPINATLIWCERR